MLSIAHTLISLPFAFLFQNPILLFLAAATMHLFADTLLHWNIYPYKFRRYPFELVALDVGGGIAIAWLLLGSQFFTLPVLVAIAGGNAPDIFHAFWEFLSPRQKNKVPRWLKKAFHTHDSLQLETTKVGKGLVSQAISVALAILIVHIVK